jgi:hypothetical protein
MNHKKRLTIFFFLCFFSPVFARDIFRTNREIYYPNSLIFFHIELKKDAYVYILNQTVSGTLHLIYPNPDDPENYFLAGTYRIPDPKFHYEFQVDEDIGEEIFYCIVSKVKISKLHARNFRDNESLAKPQWLRKLTNVLHPLDWKIYEYKIKIVANK